MRCRALLVAADRSSIPTHLDRPNRHGFWDTEDKVTSDQEVPFEELPGRFGKAHRSARIAHEMIIPRHCLQYTHASSLGPSSIRGQPKRGCRAVTDDRLRCSRRKAAGRITPLARTRRRLDMRIGRPCRQHNEEANKILARLLPGELGANWDGGNASLMRQQSCTEQRLPEYFESRWLSRLSSNQNLTLTSCEYASQHIRRHNSIIANRLYRALSSEMSSHSLLPLFLPSPCKDSQSKSQKHRQPLPQRLPKMECRRG